MIGILQLSRNEKVNHKGVRFASLSGEKAIVRTNAIGKRDCWVKVSDEHQLMEIYGPIGNPDVESRALKYHFGILPCKYPDYVSPPVGTEPPTVHAFSVDNCGTKDIDDAISVECVAPEHYTVGVHIANVTEVGSTLYEWAKTRGASVYFDTTNIGMLSPGLAEDRFSLIQNKPRPCLTVWLEWKSGVLIDSRHEKTTIMNTNATTYGKFKDLLPREFGILRDLAGTEVPEDIVQWTMLEYNKYMAEVLAALGHGLLRTKNQNESKAKYSFATEGGIHADMGLSYTHMTSPIRRFPDMYNQMCVCDLIDRVGHESLDHEALDTLNRTMDNVAHFQYQHTVLTLATQFMNSPQRVKVGERLSDFVYVYLPRRVKIPTHESYYDTGGLPDGTEVTLYGITKNGRSVLRIVSGTHEVSAVQPEPTVILEFPEIRSVDREGLTTVTEDFLGYPLDNFQLECLAEIALGGDVLGMAPTGSGKTAVAITAILMAFSQDQRAIYTSPIKALSNEKYNSFHKSLNGRVTLLTGDIKARCTPAGGDGTGELIIMTAEILRNKLVSSQTSGCVDPDLVGVSVVIQDEVHYINDLERGPVWEETTMFLDKNIQIISLSATISNAESFRTWLAQRRPTKLVKRSDRHVPLHICKLDSHDFVNLFSTHDTLTMKSTNYSFPNERSIPQLVHTLVRLDKCPAIVFCMSRSKCVDAAHAITRNLMLSTKPRRPRNSADTRFTDEEWEIVLQEHGRECQTYEQRWQSLWNTTMGRHRKDLESIPGWSREVALLKKGVGYHHAGMFPLHREFVEVLFQNKMLKVVFATETLGVGINMPARTTVFTQLDKPTGMDTKRWLKTEEFWQMAGRAGRRGMDTLGFVLYYPLGKVAPFSIFSSMVQSGPSPTESKLKIDNMFVLRNLHKGIESVSGSLLKRDIDTQVSYVEKNLPDVSGVVTADVREIIALEERLEQRVFKLTTKQLKQVRKRLKELRSTAGSYDANAMKEYNEGVARLESQRRWISDCWQTTVARLGVDGFLENGEFTAKGKAARQLCDGCPLARATLFHDGHLDTQNFETIAAVLAFFAPLGKVQRVGEIPKLPGHINNILETAGALSNKYDFEGSETASRLMYLWCVTKDIGKLSYFVPIHQLGGFIKTALRVSSFMEELTPVLMGLERYRILNQISNFQEKLFYGVVTNISLFV